MNDLDISGIRTGNRKVNLLHSNLGDACYVYLCLFIYISPTVASYYCGHINEDAVDFFPMPTFLKKHITRKVFIIQFEHFIHSLFDPFYLEMILLTKKTPSYFYFN